MKAMLLRHIAPIESEPLEWVNLPMPEPGPGEVRIRVHCCAICRTDLHVIEGDLPQQRLPMIPGHQIVGTIDKLGPLPASQAEDASRKSGKAFPAGRILFAAMTGGFRNSMWLPWCGRFNTGEKE